MKKGQGLSLNVIIVAVLCLIVLVVLIFVFSGKMGEFGERTKGCVAQGGVCKSEGQCSGPTFKTDDCTQTNQVCCIEVYKK